jgi:hypothetical protein
VLGPVLNPQKLGEPPLGVIDPALDCADRHISGGCRISAGQTFGGHEDQGLSLGGPQLRQGAPEVLPFKVVVLIRTGPQPSRIEPVRIGYFIFPLTDAGVELIVQDREEPS